MHDLYIIWKINISGNFWIYVLLSLSFPSLNRCFVCFVFLWVNNCEGEHNNNDLQKNLTDEMPFNMQILECHLLLYLNVLVATPPQREQEQTDCSFQNKNTLQKSMKNMLYSLITTTTGQDTVHLLSSKCQYLWYWSPRHASFVVGKSDDTQLKSSSTHASLCKMLVRLLLKEPFLFICYIVREDF